MMNEDTKTLKRASSLGTAWGILTMLCGFLAMGAPYVAGKAVILVVGISILAAGISMIVFSFQAPSLGNFILKLLFGGLTVLAGLAIVGQPGLALASLTMILGIYFIFDGLTTLVVAWNVKPEPGWGWMTFSGAVTLALSWMILSGWPASSLFVVGILVGIRLVFSGMTMITLGSAGRQVARNMN